MGEPFDLATLRILNVVCTILAPICVCKRTAHRAVCISLPRVEPAGWFAKPPTSIEGWEIRVGVRPLGNIRAT